MATTLEVPSYVEEQLAALLSDPPDGDPGLKVTAFGDQSSQIKRYYLYADVVAELVKAARYRSESATAILRGKVGISHQGPFAEVTAFEGLRYLYGGDGLDTTRSVLRKVWDQQESEAGEDKDGVVGVFVARPGGQARLDAEMVRLHLSLFNLPSQVLLVVDGVCDKMAVYVRRDGGRFFNTPFHLVEARRDGSEIDDSPGRESLSDNSGDSELEMESGSDDERDRRDCGTRDSGQPGQSDRRV